MDEVELFSTYDDVPAEDAEIVGDKPVTRGRGRPPRPFEVRPRGTSMQAALSEL